MLTLREADLDRRLQFLVPVYNQNKGVEVAFASTYDGRVVKRIRDNGEPPTTRYEIADLSDDEVDDVIGLNDEPEIAGEWQACEVV